MHFNPKSILSCTFPVCLSLVTPALATVFIDYVPVGDAGNPADPSGGSIYGTVAYAYQIAKNETTISQYAEFLNAVAATDPHELYNTNMATDGSVAGITRSGSSGSYTYSVVAGSGNRPIAFVTWFDAARFCNWMHNGQGSGSTETGAYTLQGETSGYILMNPGAVVWLPTFQEWYKAAYYDPTPGAGGGDNYWLHATQSDTLTNNSLSANYFDGDFAVTQNGSFSLGQNYLTDVGAYGPARESFYGTNDQGGNLWEWNDSGGVGYVRGLLGGSWLDREREMRSTGLISPTIDGGHVGFRVATVPEPTSLLLSIFAGGVLLTHRKRESFGM